MSAQKLSCSSMSNGAFLPPGTQGNYVSVVAEPSNCSWTAVAAVAVGLRGIWFLPVCCTKSCPPCYSLLRSALKPKPVEIHMTPASFSSVGKQKSSLQCAPLHMAFPFCLTLLCLPTCKQHQHHIATHAYCT